MDKQQVMVMRVLCIQTVQRVDSRQRVRVIYLVQLLPASARVGLITVPAMRKPDKSLHVIISVNANIPD